MTTEPTSDPVFFLGGHDLEMLEIRRVLEAHASRFHDGGLRWGAKASAYRREIEECLSARSIPVLIELEDDLGIDPSERIVVDHHGAAAGEDAPTSLEQVIALLGLAPTGMTRRQRLIAANDRGHIVALRDAGATNEEVAAIRAEDRAAQGITEEEEVAAANAVREAESRCGGRLTLVRCPHSRLAAISDRLEDALGGPGYRNLLVLSPVEVNFSGAGSVVLALRDGLPGSWSGGALPERGYWGVAPVPEGIVDLVEHLVGLQERP